MQYLFRNGNLAIVLIAVAALVLPALLSSGYQLRMVSIIWVFALLAMGFNLLYGITGQISMAQQAFFAIGAYGFALLQAKSGWSPFVALPAAVLIVAGVAAVIGLPLLRLRTHYLAMATLAFSLMMVGLTNRWVEFTGGSAGIQIRAITVGDWSMSRSALYYTLVAVAVIGLVIHNFIISGHLGRAMQAVRDDETGAESLGVNVTAVKLRVFVLAAVYAAVAGIGFGLISRQVNPSFGEFPILVSMLTIVVVGGLGTRFGPVIGAIVVVLAPQALARFGELETLIYGLCLGAFLIFLPNGLSGVLERLGARLFRPGSGPASRPVAKAVAKNIAEGGAG